MSVTSQEFDAFHQFAQQRIAAGTAESIEQLARQWGESRELEALIRNIEQSEADITAGRVYPAEEVFAEIR